MANFKRRIIFVNRYFFPDESATSQLLSDLAFGLSKHYEVNVVCSRQLYADAKAGLPARESVRGVRVHRLWTTRFGRGGLLGRAFDYLSFYMSCAFILTRCLCRGDIVVAETDPPLISVVAAMAARLRGAHLVNWLQDVFPEVASALGANPMPAAMDQLLRYIRNVSLRAAKFNVVLGTRMRDHLLLQRVPAEKIQVIENWTATEDLEPKQPIESELRSQLHLQEKFVVCYSGNLGRAHEYATILGAAAALSSDPSVVFLMIGGGVNMDALRLQVAQRQLPNMHFLPYQPRERLHDSLAAADVHLVNLIPCLEGLIVPSKFYGILAAARPMIFIGDRAGELARIIEESHCGLVVEIDHSLELVGAIRQLQSHVGDREAMAASALRLFRERYSAARAQMDWLTALRREWPDSESG